MRVDYLAGCSGAAPNKPPAVIVPLARAAIDLVGNLIELLLAVDRRIRAFWAGTGAPVHWCFR